jgi:hypothetical protein
LNLTRLHLGIAHESQFQELGIRRSYAGRRGRRGASHHKSLPGY